MRIALVQTYPLYHDLITTDQWVNRDTRDLVIPTILSKMGHEVELLAVGRETRKIELNGYVLQVFKADQDHKKTKFHTSTDLTEHARDFSADACILKGVDGGIGNHLIETLLLPKRVPFAFVVGGEYYSRRVRNASCMLIESNRQHTLLASPTKLWRTKYPSIRMVRLPKTVNLKQFSPSSEREKSWDVITSGRLISRYKNYAALGILPTSIRIAVAGGGPHLHFLKGKYPAIEWLGHVNHSDVAGYLKRSKIFIYTSTKDYFPRSIAEATACGLPTIAVEGNLSDDVISPDRGIISSLKDLEHNVMSLLQDNERLNAMSERCRAFALQEFDRSKLDRPLHKALDLLQSDGTSAE